MNLTHEQAQTLIDQGAYRLNIEELRALHQHLDACIPCQGYYQEFLRRENILKIGLQTHHARPHFTADELRRISSRIQRRTRWRRFSMGVMGGLQNLTWAGVTALLILGLVWLVNNIPARPSEPGITPPATSFPISPTLSTHESSDLTLSATTQPTSAPTPIPVSPQFRMTLLGHEDRVTSVAFSPDGQTLASADVAGIVKVWWAQDGSLIYSLRAHMKAVTGIAFSPDGKTLATGAKDGQVILWQAQTGQYIRTLMDDSGWVKSLAFSPSGDMVAISLNEYRVDVVETASGKMVNGSTGYSRFDVSTASTNNYMLGSSEAAVWLNNTSDLPFGLNMRGQGGKSLDTILSPDGKFLASGSTDQKIYLWQIYDVTYLLRLEDYENPLTERQVFGSLEMILEGHTGWVNGLAFSPDQHYLVSGAGDGMIKLWHLPDGKNETTLTGHQAGINGIAISPDGNLIASASDDGTVILWALTP